MKKEDSGIVLLPGGESWSQKSQQVNALDRVLKKREAVLVSHNYQNNQLTKTYIQIMTIMQYMWNS